MSDITFEQEELAVMTELDDETTVDLVGGGQGLDLDIPDFPFPNLKSFKIELPKWKFPNGELPHSPEKPDHDVSFSLNVLNVVKIKIG